MNFQQMGTMQQMQEFPLAMSTPISAIPGQHLNFSYSQPHHQQMVITSPMIRPEHLYGLNQNTFQMPGMGIVPQSS